MLKDLSSVHQGQLSSLSPCSPHRAPPSENRTHNRRRLALRVSHYIQQLDDVGSAAEVHEHFELALDLWASTVNTQNRSVLLLLGEGGRGSGEEAHLLLLDGLEDFDYYELFVGRVDAFEDLWCGRAA